MRGFLAHRSPVEQQRRDKRARAYRTALKSHPGIFAEPHAGIIPLKRRSALCWKACAARTALLSCVARKESIKTSTGVTRLRDAPAEWSRQYAMPGLSI